MPTNSELRALLAEALPSVNCSVNKWAERSCAIAQKSFRFPSGAIPTKVQVDETFSKWKQQEQLAARITAALAEKDEGEWESVGIGNTWSQYRHMKCGTTIIVEMEDSSEEAKRKHICPLPPLPERKV